MIHHADRKRKKRPLQPVCGQYVLPAGRWVAAWVIVGDQNFIRRQQQSPRSDMTYWQINRPRRMSCGTVFRNHLPVTRQEERQNLLGLRALASVAKVVEAGKGMRGNHEAI